MRLYDPLLEQTHLLFKDKPLTRLSLLSQWPTLKSKPFIFPEDSALELGGDEASSYLIAYTSDKALVKEESAFLLGKDIPDLQGISPYAHLVFVLLDEEKEAKDQQLYRLLRNIEYARYHVFPEGFSLRVNTNELKEGGRLDKKAAEKGFSFGDLATCFSKAYHQDSHVLSLEQIFITDPAFPYAELRKLSTLSEGITVTLDHILKNLKMDCQTCSYKSICDTVEGMKELHQSEREKK
jgi:hypothetical protein